MHSLKILISDRHHEKLSELKKALNSNGDEMYTLSGLISKAVELLYGLHPGQLPPKQDHLLFDREGIAWKDSKRRYIRITIHPNSWYHIDQLFECFSGPSTKSERIAAALEMYLFR